MQKWRDKNPPRWVAFVLEASLWTGFKDSLLEEDDDKRGYTVNHLKYRGQIYKIS